MIFGVIALLFSVSTTLKVCIIIIAHKKLMSSILFKLIFTKVNKFKSPASKGLALKKGINCN